MIWEIDPIHSQASFSIRVMGVMTTKGRFNTLRGRLSIDEQNSANSWVEAEAEAASIDTRNILRDAHLRSSAFFAAKKYPRIAFRSTSVEHVGGHDYRVTGNMTMHGVTKPITFDVAYSGQNQSLSMRTGLTAKVTINRNDFSLGRGLGVRFAANEMVTIAIDLEAVQQSAEVREARAKV